MVWWFIWHNKIAIHATIKQKVSTMRKSILHKKELLILVKALGLDQQVYVISFWLKIIEVWNYTVTSIVS